MKTRLVALGAALLLTIGAGACGGGSDGRPSKAELSDRIEKELDAKPAEADCIAGKLLASDMSDKVLRAIADDDQGDLSEKDTDKAGTMLVDFMSKCSAG